VALVPISVVSGEYYGFQLASTSGWVSFGGICWVNQY